MISYYISNTRNSVSSQIKKRRREAYRTVFGEIRDIWYVSKHTYWVFDISLQWKRLRKAEIKDAKTGRVSSDIQTRLGAWFPSSLAYVLLMIFENGLSKFQNYQAMDTLEQPTLAAKSMKLQV